MSNGQSARDRVLKAACELMHERGYTAVGVAEVCERAEVKKGSFYYVFGSKRRLALAVLEQYWGHAQAALESFTADGESPVDQLRCFFAGLANEQCRSQEQRGQVQGCLFGNMALEMSTQDETLRKKLVEIFDGHVKWLEEVLRNAKQAGQFPSIDPKRAADNLMAQAEGAVMMAKIRNQPRRLEALFEDVLSYLKGEWVEAV